MLSAHTFASFLNQPKGKNSHRNYFMINLHERYVRWLGLELKSPGSAVRRATDYATVSGGSGDLNVIPLSQVFPLRYSILFKLYLNIIILLDFKEGQRIIAF